MARRRLRRSEPDVLRPLGFFGSSGCFLDRLRRRRGAVCARRRFCSLRGCGLAAGRRATGFSDRNNPLADADFVADLDINLGDDAGSGGRNGATALSVSNSMNRLVLFDLIAFFDQNADHSAGVNAFTQRR